MREVGITKGFALRTEVSNGVCHRFPQLILIEFGSKLLESATDDFGGHPVRKSFGAGVAREAAALRFSFLNDLAPHKTL